MILFFNGAGKDIWKSGKCRKLKIYFHYLHFLQTCKIIFLSNFFFYILSKCSFYHLTSKRNLLLKYENAAYVFYGTWSMQLIFVIIIRIVSLQNSRRLKIWKWPPANSLWKFNRFFNKRLNMKEACSEIS